MSEIGLAISTVAAWAVTSQCTVLVNWNTQTPKLLIMETTDVLDVAGHTTVGHILANTTLTTPNNRASANDKTVQPH